LVYGDIVNIEYYEPARVAGTLKFHIDHVGYIYRGVADRKIQLGQNLLILAKLM
jgi:hypothetical protein